MTVVENGLQAVKEIKRHRYDVILMDIQMPVMGGFEATNKIRTYEKFNSLPRTPIIALTAHAMMGDRDKCLSAGMDDYLSKPLNGNIMMQTILKCAAMNIASLPLPPAAAVTSPLTTREELEGESTPAITQSNASSTTNNNTPKTVVAKYYTT